MDSLILYTNDPSVQITVHAYFGFDDSGELGALLMLDFGVAPEKQADFRWALIGRGAMDFTADMYRDGQTGREQIAQNVQPTQRSKHCGEDKRTAPPPGETIVLGDLDSARQIGAKGTNNADVLGTYVLDLKFPNAKAARSGEEYKVSLGAFGRPTEKDYTQVGSLMSITSFPPCVDLGGADDAMGIGQLNAADAEWNVQLSPFRDTDRLELADPDPTQNGQSRWTFSDLTPVKASYTDTRLQRLHQIALFAAGIVIGLGTSFLVQGITGMTTKSDT